MAEKYFVAVEASALTGEAISTAIAMAERKFANDRGEKPVGLLINPVGWLTLCSYYKDASVETTEEKPASYAGMAVVQTFKVPKNEVFVVDALNLAEYRP